MLVDRDTQEVRNVLRSATSSSGLSQNAFARVLGTSGSRFSTYLTGGTRPSAQFLMRSQRLGRALGFAATKGLMSAPITATAMRKYRLAGDVPWIWRMLLQGRDHLRLALTSNDQDLIDSWEAEPVSVGESGWDALLAAIVHHEFVSAGREPPSWSCTDPLGQPWISEHPFLSPQRVVEQTPGWLSRQNIFVPARDLVTA